MNKIYDKRVPVASTLLSLLDYSFIGREVFGPGFYDHQTLEILEYLKKTLGNKKYLYVALSYGDAECGLVLKNAIPVNVACEINEKPIRLSVQEFLDKYSGVVPRYVRVYEAWPAISPWEASYKTGVTQLDYFHEKITDLLNNALTSYLEGDIGATLIHVEAACKYMDDLLDLSENLSRDSHSAYGEVWVTRARELGAWLISIRAKMRVLMFNDAVKSLRELVPSFLDYVDNCSKKFLGEYIPRRGDKLVILKEAELSQALG